MTPPRLGSAKGASVMAILEAHAARQPDEPAVITEDLTLDYAGIVRRIRACAGHLLDRGLVPGDLTAVSLSHEIDHLIAAMALACLGTPQVNLASHETAANKRVLADRLGVTQVIAATAEDWMSGRRVIVPMSVADPIEDKLENQAAIEIMRREMPRDSVLFYLSTSGSTNVPKAFGVAFDRLLNRAAQVAGTPRARRVLRTSTVEFDSSRHYRICSLVAGTTSVFLDTLRADTLGAFCADAKVTEIHIGTYKLASLLSDRTAGWQRLPADTHVITGGSRVPGGLRKAVRDLLTDNLWIHYATSEVGPISVASPAEHEAFPEGVGYPMPGVIVEIVDAEGNPVPDGEIGEARIRKGTLPKGYVDDAAASSAFRDGWFYPKDLLSRSPGGPLEFHGRVDDLMILNGINIFPSAIEDTLESHADVQEAVAYPIRSAVHGDIPVAAVVIKPGAKPDPAMLLAYCRQKLGIRAPRKIDIVDSIPRNGVGKPLRSALAGSRGERSAPGD